MKYSSKFTLTLTFIFTCLIASCSNESSKDIYNTELIKTKELILKAEKVNGLWRDTQSLLEQAQEQAKQNNFESGIKLLQEAQFQANAGYDQAINQSNLENLIPFYLKP